MKPRFPPKRFITLTKEHKKLYYLNFCLRFASTFMKPHLVVVVDERRRLCFIETFCKIFLFLLRRLLRKNLNCKFLTGWCFPFSQVETSPTIGNPFTNRTALGTPNLTNYNGAVELKMSHWLAI